MQNEWEELFQNTFEKAKNYIQNRYPLEDDGSGIPRFVAIRKIIEQLPCPVKILLLNVNKDKFKHLKDSTCPMIYYDLEKKNQIAVTNLGEIDPEDERFVSILEEEFRLTNVQNFVNDFRKEYNITSTWEPNLSGNLQFLFYNPLLDPTEFEIAVTDMLEDTIVPILAKEVNTLQDFNKTHNLKPDEILAESDLLTKYVRMDAFGILAEGGTTRKPNIMDFQKHMANIQLIPTVNEHVKRTFDKAKKLYIFGWYVYDFFPPAEHYATLALESAIRHTYFHHFGTHVTIENQDGKKELIPNADYSRVTTFCEYAEKDWDVRRLRANGERFRYSMKELLDWLVKKKIITKWERKRCNAKLKTRNYLSHTTYAPIYPGGQSHRTIEETAYLINKMFSSLNSKY
ncbi:MAG: hypothetical protein HZA82_03400 [Thaumarchaeota archaeon]|nr:hypothetical protein [Nitrososphaerota archaeon]